MHLKIKREVKFNNQNERMNQAKIIIKSEIQEFKIQNNLRISLT